MTRRRLALVAVIAVSATLLFPRRAPADIQEQRNRLPPPVDPATCSDPVAGTWRAHPFYPDGPEWYVFDLNIERVPGDATALRGTMHVDFWRGTPSDENPPACGPSTYRKAVGETAAGTFDGTRIDFGATEWHSIPGGCTPTTAYIVDRFAGNVDPTLQEMQTTLFGAGGVGDHEPAVFRRIACPGVAPSVPPPTPPSVTPPTTIPGPAPTLFGRRLGCGC